MAILGKSVDQNCTVADGACCHKGLDSSEVYSFEIGLTNSTRANWYDLYHTAAETLAYQDWSGLIC